METFGSRRWAVCNDPADPAETELEALRDVAQAARAFLNTVSCPIVHEGQPMALRSALAKFEKLNCDNKL